MKKNNKTSNLFFVAATLFYIASTLSFFSDNTTNGVMYLLFGSIFLNLGAVNNKK